MATNGLMGSGALDKIRAWHEAALDQVSYPMIVIGALLAHLDALAAPADGEALGREARMAHMEWQEDPDVWPFLSETVREDYRRTALRLHAIGHAAGALSREGEIAGLQRSLEIETFRGDVATKLADIRDVEIARLTAELAAARDCGQDGPCATPPGCARHWEERNHELQAQIEAATDTDGVRLVEIASLEAELTTARADGAREEREASQVRGAEQRAEIKALRGHIAEQEVEIVATAEALGDVVDARCDQAATDERASIVKQVRHWAANGRRGMPVVDGDTYLVDWIATEIAESADEGRARGDR